MVRNRTLLYMAGAEEWQWLDQLKKGDQKAFQAIYDYYWEDLLGFAYQKTKSLPAAEDMVQDLFVALWNKRDTLFISQSLRSYLFSALKNQLIDHIRARITQQKYASSLDKATTFLSQTTAEQVAISEINALVHHSTHAMPERMRLVYELSRVKGHSTEKIAQQLNLSEQTVRNQISHALRRLRLQLADYLTSILLLLLFGN